jgi:hypothetical protein
VQKASALSLHESRRAQRVKNNMYGLVNVRFPSRPTELPRRRSPHSGGNPRGTWNKAEKPESPKKECTRNAFRKVDHNQAPAGGNGNKPLSTLCVDTRRSRYSFVGSEPGMLVDKARKSWHRSRIVSSSMARKAAVKTSKINRITPGSSSNLDALLPRFECLSAFLDGVGKSSIARNAGHKSATLSGQAPARSRY